jgi:hypothetical protein
MGKSTVIVSIEKPTTHLIEVDLAGVEIVTSHNVCHSSVIYGSEVHLVSLDAESARELEFFRISACDGNHCR